MIVELEFENKKKNSIEKRIYFEVRALRIKKTGVRDFKDTISINAFDVKC
jgi:hypothetical protein